MPDGKEQIQPGDKLRICSSKHMRDNIYQSDHMIVEWVEIKEDGTKQIWVRRPQNA